MSSRVEKRKRQKPILSEEASDPRVEALNASYREGYSEGYREACIRAFYSAQHQEIGKLKKRKALLKNLVKKAEEERRLPEELVNRRPVGKSTVPLFISSKEHLLIAAGIKELLSASHDSPLVKNGIPNWTALAKAVIKNREDHSLSDKWLLSRERLARLFSKHDYFLKRAIRDLLVRPKK